MRQNVISVIMGYVVAVTTTTYYVVVVVTEVKDRVGRSVVSSAIAIASPGFRIGSSVRSCVRRGHGSSVGQSRGARHGLSGAPQEGQRHQYQGLEHRRCESQREH